MLEIIIFLFLMGIGIAVVGFTAFVVTAILYGCYRGLRDAINRGREV